FHFLFDWDWTSAEKKLKRGIELDPHNVWAHTWYSAFLIGMRRFDDAYKEGIIALEIEPLSPILNALAGNAISFVNRDKGRKQLEKAIEMEPNLALAHLWVAWSYMYPEALYEKAIEHLQTAVNLGMTHALGWLGLAYGLSDKKEEALKTLKQLDELSEARYVSFHQRSLVYSGLGMYDRAFEYLEKACSKREPFLVYFWIETPSVLPKSFRMDMRYKTLRKKVFPEFENT
ncbi:MAG: hypothetical protein PVI11_05460, partial [Candidatus Aminicenantes bacterium]